MKEEEGEEKVCPYSILGLVPPPLSTSHLSASADFREQLRTPFPPTATAYRLAPLGFVIKTELGAVPKILFGIQYFSIFQY